MDGFLFWCYTNFEEKIENFQKKKKEKKNVALFPVVFILRKENVLRFVVRAETTPDKTPRHREDSSTTTDALNNMDSFLRQLKIKTGVLRRLSKEQKMYEQEVVDLGKSSSSGEEEAKLTSQQVQCLEESKAMVRDTSVRLEKAFVDLEEMVENAAKGFDGDVAEKEEFLNAREMVERVKPSLT